MCYAKARDIRVLMGKTARSFFFSFTLFTLVATSKGTGLSIGAIESMNQSTQISRLAVCAANKWI